MDKQFITAKDNVQDQWYLDAGRVDRDTLIPFMDNLMNNYSHDMTTACHAVVAVALAAITAANKYPEGGIGGNYQVHEVMGLFIRHWLRLEGAARLQLWDTALELSSKPHFTGISKSVLGDLQSKASHFLAGDLTDVSPERIAHLQSLADGKAPFGLEVYDDSKG